MVSVDVTCPSCVATSDYGREVQSPGVVRDQDAPEDLENGTSCRRLSPAINGTKGLPCTPRGIREAPPAYSKTCSTSYLVVRYAGVWRERLGPPPAHRLLH